MEHLDLEKITQCPKCIEGKKECDQARFEELQMLYGKMEFFAWMEKFSTYKELAQQSVVPSLRERYDIGITLHGAGVKRFHVNYEAKCACGFEYKYGSGEQF